MGQLKLVSELLLVTNLICISVILMILVLVPANVIAYSVDTDANCVFDTETNPAPDGTWVITGDLISERAPPQEVVWNVTTQNIKSSVSINHPHAKYLTGLRYTTRYVYRLSNDFVNFVDKENSTTIIRSVKFTCADNQVANVRFEFPIKDENDAPKFTAFPNNELMVDLTETEEDTIINSEHAIVIEDKDFDPTLNKVIVSTDRPDILLIESEETDLPTGIGKKTDVKLKLNLEATPASGRYIINLFASDGEFTEGAALKITIFRST